MFRVGGWMGGKLGEVAVWGREGEWKERGGGGDLTANPFYKHK